IYFFFFSSRRRHTRWPRDWSSDVCSSDLKSALRHLKRIKNQNSDYLSEAIEPLAVCYEKLNEEEKLVSYLLQVLEEYPKIPVVRSEEHTSELQSRGHLVCRLLLEKKKRHD